MSAPEYDPEFEAFLRRRVRFDRRIHSSLGRLEPPEELDRIIIGRAREAIQPLTAPPVFRAPKWAVPLAMAASVVVAFSLMLEVGLRPAAREAAFSPAVMVDVTNALASTQTAAPTEEAAPSAEPAAAAHTNSTHATRQRVAAGKVAPLLALRRSASASEGMAGGISSVIGRSAAAAPMPAFPPASFAAASASAAVGTRQVDPYTPAGRDDSRPGSTESEPARYAGGYAPAPIRLATAPPEMETVVVVGTRVRLGEITRAAVSVQSIARAPDPAWVAPPIPELPNELLANPAVHSALTGYPAGSASPEAAAERREHPDPKAWLDHIEKLQAAGSNGAAEQEMKLFRDAYPEYPISSGAHPADGGVQ